MAQDFDRNDIEEHTRDYEIGTHQFKTVYNGSNIDDIVNDDPEDYYDSDIDECGFDPYVGCYTYDC